MTADQRPLFARTVRAVVLLILDAALAFLLWHDPPAAAAGKAISPAIATSAAVGIALTAAIAFAGVAALRGRRHRPLLRAVITGAALRLAVVVALVCTVLLACDVAVAEAKLMVLGVSDALAALLLAVSVGNSPVPADRRPRSRSQR